MAGEPQVALRDRARGKRPSCPYIPPDLLDFLDNLYPERCPSPTATEREIWMDVGKRAVVRWLRIEAARQKETSTDR